MSDPGYTGLFVAEGSSDLPLADLVESLFLDQGVYVTLSKPDFGLLEAIPKDVRARVAAGLRLVGRPVDVVVVHRDADNAGPAARRREIEIAVAACVDGPQIIPVVPVRMTEAWLLLDEAAIRRVAGNPGGRVGLGLPKVHEAESLADPKEVLRRCLGIAAGTTGRRLDAVRKRFGQHRRQLLELHDTTGPVTRLPSWQSLLAEVDRVARAWQTNSGR